MPNHQIIVKWGFHARVCVCALAKNASEFNICFLRWTRITGGVLSKENQHHETALLCWLSHVCAALKRRIDQEIESGAIDENVNHCLPPHMHSTHFRQRTLFLSLEYSLCIRSPHSVSPHRWVVDVSTFLGQKQSEPYGAASELTNLFCLFFFRKLLHRIRGFGCNHPTYLQYVTTLICAMVSA